jgi:hypothetical protein
MDLASEGLVWPWPCLGKAGYGLGWPLDGLTMGWAGMLISWAGRGLGCPCAGQAVVWLVLGPSWSELA